MSETSGASQLRRTQAAPDPGAAIEIRVNGREFATLEDRTETVVLPLGRGANTVTLKMTGSDGSVTEYTITLTR